MFSASQSVATVFAVVLADESLTVVNGGARSDNDFLDPGPPVSDIDNGSGAGGNGTQGGASGSDDRGDGSCPPFEPNIDPPDA